MRNDDCVHPSKYLLGRHWQFDQRVAQLAAIGAFEPGVAAFFRQHRVDEERGIGVADLYRGVADLLHLHGGNIRGGRTGTGVIGPAGAGGKAKREKQGRCESALKKHGRLQKCCGRSAHCGHRALGAKSA